MLTIVTGGSGSGKSSFAESLVVKNENPIRYYIATMKPWDEECRRRIARHQNMRREKGFETIEYYGNLDEITLPRQHGIVLVECLSNLAANICFENPEPDDAADEMQMTEKMRQGICHIMKQAEDVILVTNEVFSDGCIYEEQTDQYLRTLGALNCLLGSMADAIAEVVYGIPVWHKGGM